MALPSDAVVDVAVFRMRSMYETLVSMYKLECRALGIRWDLTPVREEDLYDVDWNLRGCHF
jgi:hypothetical protein